MYMNLGYISGYTWPKVNHEMLESGNDLTIIYLYQGLFAICMMLGECVDLTIKTEKKIAERERLKPLQDSNGCMDYCIIQRSQNPTPTAISLSEVNWVFQMKSS